MWSQELAFVDSTLEEAVRMASNGGSTAEIDKQLRRARAALGMTRARECNVLRWPDQSAGTSEANSLFGSAQEGPNDTKLTSGPVFGFLHLALAPGWQEVFDELMADIHGSGLYARTERLFLGVVGPGAAVFEINDDRMEVVYRAMDLAEFEFPTLLKLHQHCIAHDGFVFYLHSKGVFSRGQFASVDDWRRYLTYFVVRQHEQCIRHLGNGFDVAGVNWQLRPWPHFSGNFWWARAAFIRSLPDPRQLSAGDDARRGAERWIGLRPDVRVACLHQSLIDHYQSPYPADRYAGYSPGARRVQVGPAWKRPSCWQGLENSLHSPLETIDPISLVVAVGVGYGYSLFSLARALPFAKVIGVDAYTHSTAPDPKRMPTPDCNSQGATAGAREWVLRHKADFPNIRLICHESPVAVHLIEHPIDLLHFGELGNYDEAAAEFRRWEPKVRPGGCIMLHGIVRDPDGVGRFFRELSGDKSAIGEHGGLGFWYKPVPMATSVPPSLPVVGAGPLLSILIPTLPSRESSFRALLGKLQSQVLTHGLSEQVEVLWFLDQKENSVGAKRNALMFLARGRFVVFVDDDDDVDSEYVPLLCRAIREHPEVDCIGFVGELTWAGSNPSPTIYSLKYVEATDREVAPGHRVYLRPPQHVNPIRRDVAVRFPFPDVSCGEDLARCMDLVRGRALSREYFLGDRVMYRYAFDPVRTETQRPAIPSTQ